MGVSKLVHHWDGQRMFADWIKLGDSVKFNQRLNQVTIEIDPGIDSVAQYSPGSETITIKVDPTDFFFGTTSSGNSFVILWHEAIHSISHGHQLGKIKPSTPFKGAPAMLVTDSQKSVTKIGVAEEAIDHLYMNWAEGCIAALPMLEKLEDHLKANGKKAPPPDVKAKTQKLWSMFVKRCNASGFGQLPDEAERKELEQMTGFHFDTNEILNGYLSLGYSQEYFSENVTDEQIWKLFPTSEQIGMPGVVPSKKKSSVGILSMTYSKTWQQGPPGRTCCIQLTLYGSDQISKAVWNKGSWPGSPVKVPGVGSGALSVDRGSTNSYFAIAYFRNAHVLMTDLVAEQPSGGPFVIKRLPINWNYCRWVFRNMEALPVTPIPSGVATTVEELRGGR
jgi:hypothetical protein